MVYRNAKADTDICSNCFTDGTPFHALPFCVLQCLPFLCPKYPFSSVFQLLALTFVSRLHISQCKH